jgi:hypothetical protein
MSWFVINSKFKGSVLTEENVHGSTAWVKKDQFSLGTINWCMVGYVFTVRRLINFHLYRNSFVWAERNRLHNSSLVLLLILAKYIFDGSTNVMTSETWFLLLWPQVSIQNDEYGLQKYAYESVSFTIQCQDIWVMCCKCVVNHWTNIFSANYKFRSVCEHCIELFSTTFQLKKQVQHWLFRQGNAAAHTTDKRRRGYYIQDVFKRNS